MHAASGDPWPDSLPSIAEARRASFRAYVTLLSLPVANK